MPVYGTSRPQLPRRMGRRLLSPMQRAAQQTPLSQRHLDQPLGPRPSQAFQGAAPRLGLASVVPSPDPVSATLPERLQQLPQGNQTIPLQSTPGVRRPYTEDDQAGPAVAQASRTRGVDPSIANPYLAVESLLNAYRRGELNPAQAAMDAAGVRQIDPNSPEGFEAMRRGELRAQMGQSSVPPSGVLYEPWMGEEAGVNNPLQGRYTSGFDADAIQARLARLNRIQGSRESGELGKPQQPIDAGVWGPGGRSYPALTQAETQAMNQQNERKFQPQSGAYGNSSVTVDPSGRATVRGNYPPRRLNDLGVVERTDPMFQGPVQEGGFPPTVQDRTLARMRQALNRRRMENTLKSRRLGIENPLPAAPYQPGDIRVNRPAPSAADLQAGLATQAEAREILNREQMARRGPSAREAVQQMLEPQNRGPDDATRRRNQMNQLVSTFAPQLASGEMTMDQVEGMADRMLGTGGGSAQVGQGPQFETTPQGAERAAQWIAQNAPAVQAGIEQARSLTQLTDWLTENGYQPESPEHKAALAAYLGRRTPGEQERQRAQHGVRNYGVNDSPLRTPGEWGGGAFGGYGGY